MAQTTIAPRGAVVLRLVGVDLARGLGLLGVFVAHTAPASGVRAIDIVLNISEHVSAPLFTLILGVSLGLMTQRGRKDARERPRLRRQLAVRALLLVILGIAVGYLGAQVIPILSYFGVVVLLLIPLMFVRTRWLIVPAAMLVALSPLAQSFVPGLLGGWLTNGLAASGQPLPFRDPVSGLASFLFYDPGYRVSGLLVFALAGLAASRYLASTRMLFAIATIGGGLVGLAVILSSASGATLAAYSGSVPELLKATGLALIILGACCLLVAAAGAPRRSRVASTTLRLLDPVRILGTMSLTFYVLHIVVLGVWAHVTDLSDDSWPLLLGLIVGSLTLSVLWNRLVGKGLLEWLMGAASFGITRWR